MSNISTTSRRVHTRSMLQKNAEGELGNRVGAKDADIRNGFNAICWNIGNRPEETAICPYIN